MPASTLLTLTTEHLILRQFNKDDTQALFKIVQEPDIFRYFPTKTPWPMEKVESAIAHQLNSWRLVGYGQWAVTLKESGQFMGWCGLESLSDTNETEVGYLLSQEYWGMGYATEAARESVKFGLETTGLKEIIGLTDPENTASQRVLEKCGMTFTRRQVYFGMEMFRYAIQV
jgi:RimJ/RimL family protein N-acetyltransferase